MSNRTTLSTPRPEMRFISSLPIDEAVQVLAALAAPDTPVTLTEVNPDTWRFAIGYYEPGKKAASVTIAGVLRRWQGTFTRLDCAARVAPRPRSQALFQTRILATGIMGVLIVLLMLARGLTPRVGSAIVPVVAVLTFIGLVLTAYMVRQAEGRPFTVRSLANDERLNQREQLLWDIHRVFKLAGDVSDDEADLNPDDDPGIDAVLDRDPTGEHRVVRRRD